MRAWFAIVLLALLVQCSQAIQFFLRQGEELCLSEMAPRGELLVGDFTVSPTGSRVQVQVNDPQGQSIYSKAVDGTGKFAHTSTIDGEYRACFTNSEGFQQKTVDFQFKTGVQAKDFSQVAKKNNLKPIEVELKRLEETSVVLRDEILYMKEREQAMRLVTDSTSSRILWFSIFSMIILVTLGLVQINYLKRYFQNMRIIP